MNWHFVKEENFVFSCSNVLYHPHLIKLRWCKKNFFGLSSSYMMIFMNSELEVDRYDFLFSVESIEFVNDYLPSYVVEFNFINIENVYAQCMKKKLLSLKKIFRENSFSGQTFRKLHYKRNEIFCKRQSLSGFHQSYLFSNWFPLFKKISSSSHVAASNIFFTTFTFSFSRI